MIAFLHRLLMDWWLRRWAPGINRLDTPPEPCDNDHHA